MTVFGKAWLEGFEDLKPLLAEDGQAVAPGVVSPVKLGSLFSVQ